MVDSLLATLYNSLGITKKKFFQITALYAVAIVVGASCVLLRVRWWFGVLRLLKLFMLFAWVCVQRKTAERTKKNARTIYFRCANPLKLLSTGSKRNVSTLSIYTVLTCVQCNQFIRFEFKPFPKHNLDWRQHNNSIDR